MATALRRDRRTLDIWPGFVDAISGLLIIILFLLMVFTLAQHFLSQILSGQDEALERLNRQIAEISDLLALERDSSADLRSRVSELSLQLQSSIAARDRMASQLSELMPERESLAAQLEQANEQRNELRARLDELDKRYQATLATADTTAQELADANRVIDADKETITAQLGELAQLRRDIESLRTVRADLEKQVTTMAASLQEEQKALTVERDRSKELQARLSTAEERTALAQAEISKSETSLRDLRLKLSESTDELSEERRISAEANRQVETLNIQIAALRQQLAKISAALDVSEAKAAEQNVQIADLGKRLNAALANKVEELARYRSEFFGKLREVLGDRRDVRVVGDRFVFQSEVLFRSGSAELNPAGVGQIERLAQTLNQIAPSIPNELNWVLRVDGHTDKVPISTPQFASNWELSTARAISVVKRLIAAGVPPERLAATGFGEFQPLDPRDDEIAFRRNRRIEFKLTER